MLHFYNCFFFSVFDNMDIPYPKRKFLLDDDGKDDKDKVSGKKNSFLVQIIPLPASNEENWS